MNKKTVGFLGTFYGNTLEAVSACKRLMEELAKQIKEMPTNIKENIVLLIVEDGTENDWIKEYENSNIKYIRLDKNYGVSYARNVGLDYLIDNVDYICFLDMDDIIEDNYLRVMHEYCADRTHEIIESTFLINGEAAPFIRNSVRCGVAGSALQTKIIGDERFKNELQIGEDTDFMHRVCDLSKYRKKHAPTQYIYQLGINKESLTMKYNRREIEKER